MNIGDKVRLRDGVLPWITKRDGWEVEDSYNGYGLILEVGGVTVSVPWGHIEPESPSIPPEPPRVVGQAWRDANGQTVVTLGAKGGDYVATRSDDYSWLWWEELAHPLTPLYPVPDPDDDEAVEAVHPVKCEPRRGEDGTLCCERHLRSPYRVEIAGWGLPDKALPCMSAQRELETVRAVLRALRTKEES